MRQEALTTIKGGLSRQRLKGGALKDALFDLLNGYVTTEKTVKSRPGTSRQVTLPAGTKGLVHHNNSFHVFASSVVAGIPTGYTLNVLRSPDNANLARVHFAEPFLDNLYVAAEFDDGNVYHYWLRDSEAWQPTTQYRIGEFVQPTTENGYTYIPKRNGRPFPAWSPNAEREVGDKVEPTSYNGYYFEVVSVSGATPRSGVVEPGWVRDSNIVPGKRYVESADGTFQAPIPTPPPDPEDTPPINPDDNRRYGPSRGDPTPNEQER